MPSINNIKLTVGVEATAGLPVSRSKVVPISGVVTVDRKANTGEDPAIVGNNMSTGEYILFADVGGDIPLTVRPVGGFAMLVKSALGSEEAAPKQIAGCLRIRYTGASANSYLKATAPSSLIHYKGTRGAETADTNFGTGGTLTLTGTLGAIVATIEAYTDIECEKVLGLDSLDIATVVVAFVSRESKNTWAYVWFTGTSGAYRHVFTANMTSTERPTLTLQKDGYQDNFLYAGCVVDQLNISGALKAMIEGSASILGFTETGSQNPSGLNLDDYEPCIFYNGDFSIGAHEYSYIRNFELTFQNNSNPDGYGVGTLDRQYHQKGMTGVTGNVNVRLDSNSYAERAKIFANTKVALVFYMKGGIINATATVPELILIELPYCSLQTFDFAENAGVFDAQIAFRAVKPKGTLYSEPITITMLNSDVSVY